MKIALVGYGKMGHMIEAAAKAAGHEVVATVDVAAKDASVLVPVGDGNAVAEAVKKYFFKGKPILVEGRLQSRDWEDKNGMKRRSWEIIVDNFEFMGGDKKPQEETPVAPPEIAPVPGGDPFATADGELPF